MNFKFYPMRALLLTLLLFSFKAGVQAQIEFFKTVENVTDGGDGSTADPGEELRYTMYITNKSTQNYVACKMYDNVPAGVTYIAGSTRMNGNSNVVPDKTGGVMPFSGNGSPVRSPGFGAGILAPESQCVVSFRVRVTANGGSIFNNATIEAAQNSVATIQATNTVYTSIIADLGCNEVYATQTYYPDPQGGLALNPDRPELDEWSFLRKVRTDNGTSTGTTYPTGLLYNGVSGYKKEALPYPGTYNGNNISDQLMDHCAAIAYDRARNRIYFVNNTTYQDLCYVDLNIAFPTAPSSYRVPMARRWTGYRVTSNNNDNNYRINRMGMGSDGYLYCLSSNGRDFIRISFTAGDVPIIEHRGSLINATTNGSKNVLSESGGDLFADGSGKLYLITNASNMYKINPASRVATYMGKIKFNNPSDPNQTFTSQSLAIDIQGNVYIGGAYQDVYKLDLFTMETTKLNATTNNVFHSGDFTTCGFPVLASSIIADKTYRDLDGDGVVNGGDIVEYIITITNMGNINAAGVYMYDYIPPSTTYIAGTTRMNGIPVADVGGVMPFAVSGGRLVNSPGEDPGIILPTGVNSAVVTFQVRTEPNRQVCNQSRISLLDADGNVMFVNSSDPTNIGQTPTCFYSDGILPLVNLKFKGSLNGEKSVLNWTMTGDESVNYYEVEYSANGTSFSTTGKVAAKGNTQTTNSYTYTDGENTFSPIRYYRLKVVQKDGNYSYSGIIRLNAQDMEIQAVPNPFDRDINVQVRIKTAETVRIRLVDFYGREVYSSVEQLSIGNHSISIRVPAGLAKGMYVLDVRAGGEQIYQTKMLKK